MDEVVAVREEQVSANQTSEFLAVELRAERMYSETARGPSGNRGDPQESGGTNAEGSELSRRFQELVQRFEDFSSETHANFEGVRLDLEKMNEKRRMLSHSLGGFQGDLQGLAETVGHLRGGRTCVEVGQGNGQKHVNSTVAPGNRDAPGNLFADSPAVGQPTEVFADTLSVHSGPEPPVVNVVDVLGRASLKESDKLEVPPFF